MRDSERGRRSALTFYAVAGAVLVFDQLTKSIARVLLVPDEPRTVIPGLFDLKLGHNLGAAFGVLPDWAPLLIVAALVAVYAIVRLGQARESSRAFVAGLGLLLGGAVGNLIDRLTSPTQGVTDFLSFHIRYQGVTHIWPTFNLADAAIVVGALVLLYHVFVLEKRSHALNSL